MSCHLQNSLQTKQISAKSFFGIWLYNASPSSAFVWRSNIFSVLTTKVFKLYCSNGDGVIIYDFPLFLPQSSQNNMLIRKLFFNICNDFFILQKISIPKDQNQWIFKYYFSWRKSNFYFYPLKPELFSYTIYLTLLKKWPIPNSLSIQISPW
jgi:hypothetical protein